MGCPRWLFHWQVASPSDQLEDPALSQAHGFVDGENRETPSKSIDTNIPSEHNHLKQTIHNNI